MDLLYGRSVAAMHWTTQSLLVVRLHGPIIWQISRCNALDNMESSGSKIARTVIWQISRCNALDNMESSGSKIARTYYMADQSLQCIGQHGVFW